MYGLALCLPSVEQPQGLVLHEIPKTQKYLYRWYKAIPELVEGGARL